MSRRSKLIAGLAACTALSFAIAHSAAACVPDPGRKPIQISVGSDGKPVVSDTSVSACEGETIRWVFQGSAARDFAVSFTSADNSPFTWATLTGSTVEGTVKPGAAKNGKRTEYDYAVSFDAQASDPKIIINP